MKNVFLLSTALMGGLYFAMVSADTLPSPERAAVSGSRGFSLSSLFPVAEKAEQKLVLAQVSTANTTPAQSDADAAAAALLAQLAPLPEGAAPAPVAVADQAAPATAAAPVAEGDILYVAADKLNVRASASKSGEVLDRLVMGDEVRVVAIEGDWAHVVVEGDGIDGFVAAKFLQSANPLQM